MLRTDRRVVVSLWVAVLVALPLSALAFWRFKDTPPNGVTITQGIASIGGPFELTSEDGSRFSSNSLSGRPFAIFFGFTHCPDVCPTSMFELAKVLEEVGEPARDFKVLFVTVDPERDTPELLKAYTDSFDPRIVGLTGTADEILAIARTYRAYYRRVPLEGGGYTMDHTASVYLMNARGAFVGTLAYREAHDTKVAKLQRLIAGGS